MSAEIRFIGEDTKQSATPRLTVNTSTRYIDDLYHPRRLIYRLTLDVSTAAGSGVTIVAATFLRACQLTQKYASDNCAVFDALPLYFLDWVQTLQQDALAAVPLHAVDKTILQNTANQTVVYEFPVLVELPLAARPDDYAMCISEFGDVELNVGAIGTAGATVNSCRLEVIAEGRTRSAQVVGLRQSIKFRNMSGQDSDAARLGGHKLISTSYIAHDPTTEDVSDIEGLTVKVDSSLLVDGGKLGAIDNIPTLGGEPFYNPSSVAPAYVGFCPLYQAPWRHKVSELPVGAALSYDYRTQNTPNAAASIVQHTIAPMSGAQVVGRIASAAGVDPSQLPQLITRERINPAKPMTEAMKVWLPREWRGPVRRTAGGCAG